MDAVAFADIKAVSREFFRERGKNVPRLLRVAVANGRHRQHHARERRQVMPARSGDLELAYPQLAVRAGTGQAQDPAQRSKLSDSM